MIPLLPAKHVRLNETLLGLGALIIETVKVPRTLDELWNILKELRTRKKLFPERITFDDLVLAVDLLFALRVIELNEYNQINRCGSFH